MLSHLCDHRTHVSLQTLDPTLNYSDVVLVVFFSPLRGAVGLI